MRDAIIEILMKNHGISKQYASVIADEIMTEMSNEKDKSSLKK